VGRTARILQRVARRPDDGVGDGRCPHTSLPRFCPEKVTKRQQRQSVSHGRLYRRPGAGAAGFRASRGSDSARRAPIAARNNHSSSPPAKTCDNLFGSPGLGPPRRRSRACPDIPLSRFSRFKSARISAACLITRNSRSFSPNALLMRCLSSFVGKVRVNARTGDTGATPPGSR